MAAPPQFDGPGLASADSIVEPRIVKELSHESGIVTIGLMYMGCLK
jgi:hypothetical protein